jgi:hypothetical protein
VGGDTFFQRGGFYAAAPWRGIQATPSPVRARLLVGGDTPIQRGGFYAAAPWRGVQATPQAQLVVPGSGAVVGSAVILLSSVAGSMPPHRGTVFKQRPRRFGGGCWVGGDTFFQRGGFYAAAPWRIFQATPSMFRAQCWVGRGWTKRPKRKSRRLRPTRLAWVSPRRAGGTVKVRFSFDTAPVSTNPPTHPSHNGTHITDSLSTTIQNGRGRGQTS